MPELFVEPITKSVGEWHLPLGSGAGFFKSLTVGMLGFLKSPADGFKGFLEPALNAGSLNTLDPGQVAYHLIYQSLKFAAYKLIDDRKEVLGTLHPRSEPIADRLDEALQHTRLTIDDNFVKSANHLSFWSSIKGLFTQWLVEVFGVAEETAQGLSNRLPLYFEIALDEEWSRYPEDYQILKDKLLTPLTPLAQQARGWLHYMQHLEDAITRPILGEDFGLETVYIPLRGYYEQEIPGKKHDIAESYHQKEKKYHKRVVDLETCLNKWLARNDPRDALRVISGEPGSGKSCLARMFAARQIRRGDRQVWFIPLHLFDATAGLESALQDFAASQKIFGDHSLPFLWREDRHLLIFDALDELELGGKAWEEISRQFIERLETALMEWNRDQASVLVLVTGRILAVREYRHRFCRESREAILHLLPYYLPKVQIEHHFDEDSQILLTTDQRDEWWRIYGQACGRIFFGLPDELRQEKLDELTARPILNHLVAQLYRDGKLHLSGESNINSVYYQMIRSIYDRVWEPGHPHGLTRDMPFDDFVHTLEEIGVAAWHGDRRRARETGILARLDKAPPLKHILESFKQREGAKAVSRLLTGFFFGPGEEEIQGDRTYEFTHKSFGEYLFGRSLVRLLANIHCNFMENQSDYQRGWGARLCIDAWAKLCGPSPLDEDLFALLSNEIILLKNNEPLSAWQETLAALIGFMLTHGMYGEDLPRMSYRELCRQARNAELALLAILNACALVTERISLIQWPYDFSAGDWLARLLGQRGVAQGNYLSIDCLSFLDLSNQVLVVRDFVGANLHRSNLCGVMLLSANMIFANLIEANLHQADLCQADLRGADLCRADLSQANLSETILHQANLSEANLCGATLGWADLCGANLCGADLCGADLQYIKINEGTKVWGIKIDADTKITKGSQLEELLKKMGVITPGKTRPTGRRHSR